MKKLLLFFSLLLSLLPLSLPAAAETQTKTATIVFGDIWGTASGPNTITEEYATIKFDKNDATTACAYNVNSDKFVRLYKPNSGKTNGGGITITPSGAIQSITSVKLIKSDNSETDFSLNQDGSFVFINKTTSTIKVKSLKITYEVEIINTPAGLPVVNINDCTIEDGCFYEISKGSTATVTAQGATTITANDVLVEDGSFKIEEDGLYTITSSNSIGDSSITFNVTVVNPQVKSEEVWKLITTSDFITDDGEYLIVNTNNGKTISTVSNVNNRKEVAIHISENIIAELPETAMIFNIKATENQYEWYTTNYQGTKGYLQGVAGKNYLKVSATSGTDTKTSINFDDNGNAQIEFVNCKSGSTLRKIGYNQDSSLFAAYVVAESSTNRPVQIYTKTTISSPIHSTKEYLDLPDFEHDVTAKTITFTCPNPNVLFEEKHYDATSSQSYAPKAVADGWNAMADGVFDHSAFTNDIILETRAYREDADGNRVVESPIHAMRVNASGTVTGIESVAAEAEGEGELFNLQGVRVNRATAAPGLYIERRGGKAVKVIL